MILNILASQISNLFGNAPSTTTAGSDSVILIFSTVLSLLICFLGYKLKKIWITIIGFFVGLLLGMIPCLLWIKLDAVLAIALIVGLVVGVLVAIIAYRCFRVGVFIWVSFMTFASVQGLFGDKLEWLGIAVGIIVGLAVGILTFRYMRLVCIYSTAVNGGILSAQKILQLFGVSNILLVLILAAVLTAFGVIVQLRMNRQDEEKQAAKK